MTPRRRRLAVVALALAPAVRLEPAAGAASAGGASPAARLEAAAVGVMPLAAIGSCTVSQSKVETIYTGPGRPVSRSLRSPVTMVLADQQITRPYEVLGAVRVSSTSREETVSEMTMIALGAVREMGGDALIDVRQAMEPGAGAGIAALLGGHPATRHIVTGCAVRWR